MPSVDKDRYEEGLSSYQDFALVYDEMMAELPYPVWASYVTAQAERYGIVQPGPVLDLACGTGIFLELMAEQGWDGTGVDLSSSMLAVAEERLSRFRTEPRLFCQDLRELELTAEFPLITCLCDSLNYITSPQDLQEVLSRVKKLLSPQGVFIADLNSCYKYANILGDNVFSETYQNSAYIWVNTFDQKSGICRMELDFFLRKRGELFRHFHETHIQKAYSINDFVDLAKKAGFSSIEVFGAFSFTPPAPDEERIFFLCRG